MHVNTRHAKRQIRILTGLNETAHTPTGSVTKFPVNSYIKLCSSLIDTNKKLYIQWVGQKQTNLRQYYHRTCFQVNFWNRHYGSIVSSKNRWPCNCSLWSKHSKQPLKRLHNSVNQVQKVPLLLSNGTKSRANALATSTFSNELLSLRTCSITVANCQL